ncbi:DUF6470 family protein [Gelria sp. Kuro-4]|uniref:DUF6470 family protein n=1 Tax=Gelria sp. Kuro-4 TaxID=2796927 RepID=UPI001BEF28CE|nr:DUF6470 family protein [Gelria sp. Kuro-4]BCV25527.1 hypothetical protein kuro4_23000 [Gelria sp. Kuro-4]
MQRVTLEIHTQPALIGLETKTARAPIRTGLRPLRLEIAHPRLALDIRRPRVFLDASAAWSYAGLASYAELGFLVRDQSYQDVLAAIGEAAEEGDRLAAFWLPGNTIPDVAAEKPSPRPPFNYGAPPVDPVQSEVIPGNVRGEFSPGHAAAYLGPQPPGTPYEPGALRVYLRQYPAIEIRAHLVDESV